MAPDINQLAERAVGTATGLARRGRTLALGAAAMAAVLTAIAVLIVLAATDGSRTAWLLIVGVLGAVAIGSPLSVWAGLGRVAKSAPKLVGELRTLLSSDDAARRTVIDIDTGSAPSGPTTGPAGMAGTTSQSPAVIGQARQFFQLRQMAVGWDQLSELRQALTSIGTFPGRIAIGLIALVFLAMATFVLLVIWIF